MNSTIFFMLAGIVIIAGVLLAVISFMRRGPARLDTDKYRSRWLEIERLLSRSDARSYQHCVIEADKLLDQALKESGARGATMGERLKDRKSQWSDRNGVWEAHKLRNRLVHEAGYAVGYDEARRALSGFKRALKDIGAI